jgi:ArsR family transcriptional regulator, arsenate/arsenite/antimonite-responsive transcriptional repressor
MANLIPGDHLDHVARRFRLLGEPARLRLLNALHASGELHVQGLVETTGLSQANVSKHLRLLLDEGLVARRQEGHFAYYRLDDPMLGALCLLVCGSMDSTPAAPSPAGE